MRGRKTFASWKKGSRKTISRTTYSPVLLKQMLNPFIGGSPKFLDGGRPTSSVVNRSISFEINTDPGQSSAILLSPHLQVPIVFTEQVLELSGELVNNQTCIAACDNTKRFDLNECNYNCSNTDGYREPGNADTQATRGAVESEISAWRLVNLGMKLSLLNDSDSNDGWFEAYRIHEKPRIDEICMYRDAEETGGSFNKKSFYLGISGQYIMEKAATQYRTAQKTYTTGPLKQIGKYLFSVQPVQFHHPFIDIPEYHASFWQDHHSVGEKYWWYNRHKNPWGYGGGSSDDNQYWSLTENTYKMIDKFYDLSFDMIMVIIHAGANGSKTLVTCAGHHEVSYKATSPKQRFETKSRLNVQLDRKIYAARAMKRNKI